MTMTNGPTGGTPNTEGQERTPDQVNQNDSNQDGTSAASKRSFAVPTSGNKKQRVDPTTEGPEGNQATASTTNDDPMVEDETPAGTVDYGDILHRNVALILDRENTSKKTAMTIKLRFKPVTQLRIHGTNKAKEIENPMIAHLRKFMTECLEITGHTAVFRTFTSGKEFDYKHSLNSDKQAEQELLAAKQTFQRFTHVMMIRLELVTRVSQFKKDITPWARKNDSLVIEHMYPKKAIETVRIGFIHSKHPVDTYRTDYQEELNIKLNADINKMTKPERLKVIEEETGDVEGTIPRVRVINHYLSWVFQRQKIETRGLVIECLKVDKRYVIKRLQKVFDGKNRYNFVPFSFPFTRSRMNGGEQYFNLLRSHKKAIENLLTLPVIGLTIEQMTAVTPENVSIREELLANDSIEAVERTPGTTKIGKWHIITQKQSRQRAEKVFDELIKQRFKTEIENNQAFKIPFRAQIDTPFEYVDNVIKEQATAGDMDGTVSTISTAQLENRMDGIVIKCDDTVAKCTAMLDKIDNRNKDYMDKMKEEFNQERTEFKNFLTDMMKRNDAKFTELYEFKNQQEFVNHQIEADLGLLKREV